MANAITLHSFRRFVKTVVEDQTSHSFSEYLVGHKKSPYYNKKEPERRELFRTRCIRYLTFLDYSALEAAGKSIDAIEKKEVGEPKSILLLLLLLSKSSHNLPLLRLLQLRCSL
jgi:hypothetical protein